MNFSQEELKALEQMPFLEFLEYMRDRLDNVPNTKKSYSLCNDISRIVIERYLKENNLDWDNYTHNEYGANFKRSEDLIKVSVSDFKNQFWFDMGKYISFLKRAK